MEEIKDNCIPDTIPVLDVERKTIPVFCPWSSSVSGIAKTDVAHNDRIYPSSILKERNQACNSAAAVG
jgi:hypothetical protein